MPAHGPKGNPHNRFGKNVSGAAKKTKGSKGKQKSRFGKAISRTARSR
jgi:hypothetical protein